MRIALALACCLVPLAACSALRRDDGPVTPQVSVSVIEAPGADVLRPLARPVAHAAGPVPVPAADGALGETLAGLGAPGEAGLWLRTGLVAAVRQGRIVAASGRDLRVELRPSGADPGAGSQISLAAMQALGLALGQLAQLRVYAQ